MVSTRKKRQSNRRPLSQLDDFDQDVIIGNAKNRGQEITKANEGTADQELTVGISIGGPSVNKKYGECENLRKMFQ